MSGKIFRSVIAVATAVLLVSLAFTSGFIYDYFNKSQITRLKEELSLARIGAEQSGTAFFENYTSDTFRFTLISADGSVLCDSAVKTAKLENHLDREEIKEALQNGSGSSARYSKTLTERTFYEAVRLGNGDILRISATQVTVATLIIGMLPMLCAIVLFSIAVAVILSRKTAKSIVAPLEALDLENPDGNSAYEELTPVLSRLSRQHRQIDFQLRELNRKSDEFEQITASLNEGLVLLNGSSEVISINPAAKKLFSTGNEVTDHSFLTVDRSEAMRIAVNKALAGEKNEFCEKRNGKEYCFMITPTLSGDKVAGAVILCIDVSTAALAECNRREFTANVSHELKTPLQSIIGSAELLENGLVKPEDTKRFVCNIKTEAERLVSLINDIIRLSQLEEHSELPLEEVDLYEEARKAAELLTAFAAKMQVELSVTGESCIIGGVKSYIYEIVYNLCDNAVRYNKAGGSVEIAVKRENGRAVLTVTDTGVGIPPEHQSRIFERFYRVDKSHSKETGGTGLGLSIVKHAAASLNATVRLESRVNFGTTVTVTF